MVSLLSCCLTSTEARWPIRDGDRVGRGRESERLDRGNRPKTLRIFLYLIFVYICMFYVCEVNGFVD